MATEQANIEVKQVNPKDVIKKVVVHPLVLLSVVDHFNRMSKIGNQKRVAGVLLGSIRNKVLDVANSFAGKTLYSLITLLKTFCFSEAYFSYSISLVMVLLLICCSLKMFFFHHCYNLSNKIKLVAYF